jgi:RimJ/RimL family protein N-acetyltransferase
VTDAVLPPEVQTERLLLRQWRDDDAVALAEIWMRPDVMRLLPAPPAAEIPARVRGYRKAWSQRKLEKWAVEDLESRRLIGRIGLARHADWPLAPDPVEVGWMLHPAWWGRGLATEAARVAVACWRESLDDARLLSITRPDNVASRAVMERLGLTLRGSATWRGYEHVWYALDRD